MDAFLTSTVAVAIAEIGDKTQLLSLFLVARYTQRLPIVLGILVATLVNHAISAWLGAWVAAWIPLNWLPWVLAVSFVLIALWLLVPDKDDSNNSRFLGMGAFMATTVMFFLAEIGDKTQIATVVLAARFTDTIWVIIGTTAGMLLANIPVIMAGHWLMKRLPLATARVCASMLFAMMAVVTLSSVVWNS
ncbi:TMEM165/GDT1 family protein [Marinobacter sp. S6332]|uniref:TMEM165/GDT1 family protein n=1 Tax=Marinobacter sp. S6332 TaxID=2926403 RepID=UPI001FF1C88C|nr:TMEM165/GDT1 family protein [Marinobacter sp. S6332]MCK0162586.1 TMEM165/GDT1 family protein [Marinobacter sp. S6332]